jgi:acetylglutamate kinase
VLDARNQVISEIDAIQYEALKAEKVIVDGMIPKLDNAFRAIEKGVQSVRLVSSQFLIDPNIEYTKVVKS